MNNYKEIDFDCGATIEECVKELLVYKEKGILVFGKFNGHILYSDKVTLDLAYKQITGQTKAEYDKDRANFRKQYEKEQQEYLERIPELKEYWIKKGREILNKNKWEIWDDTVPKLLEGIYKDGLLRNCLDIISLLNKDKFNDAVELVNNQGHSGLSFSLICSMISMFSDNGDELIYLLKN